MAGTGSEDRILCQHAALRSISTNIGLKIWESSELIFIQSVGGYIRAPTQTSHICRFSQTAVGASDAMGCSPTILALRSFPIIF